MAKFLAALLGCTLPSKGASPVLEGTIFSTLAGEKSSSDYSKVRRGHVRSAAESRMTACLRITGVWEAVVSEGGDGIL